MQKLNEILLVGAVLGMAGAGLAYGGGDQSDIDAVMQAMVDELERSMNELQLDDLPRPYFIQYRAEDRDIHTMSAAYGAVTASRSERNRSFGSRVRVGSYELDNTNVGRGGGARATLPLDDDSATVRHAIWAATDADYKRAVETLTRKKAYLKNKTIEDRPDDFSPGEPISHLEPFAELIFDERAWQTRLERLSGRFKEHPQIQDSSVTFFAGLATEYLVNSEGTRLRTSDTGAYLEINARTQAEEGMVLSDSLQYVAEQPDQLVPVEQMLADINEMCAKLLALARAPQMELYTGPVLFDPLPAGKVFTTLFADRVCARPIPLGGGGRWADTSLEKKIGRRVLPRSFEVYDDPVPEWFEHTLLAAAYDYDDEGTPATRVSIVENGILRNLVAARAPTKKIKKTTGHGRSLGLGDTRATVSCLYISDEDGVSAAELKEELIEAAQEEGLDYGLRVAAMEPGGYGSLGSPIYAYKVYVEDGREELVRGLEFTSVETRALKHILAAGTKRKAYNSLSGVARTIIAPAILMEELELKKFAEEFDKPPILKSPATRDEQ